jgi:hypothetical protein
MALILSQGIQKFLTNPHIMNKFLLFLSIILETFTSVVICSIDQVRVLFKCLVQNIKMGIFFMKAKVQVLP